MAYDASYYEDMRGRLHAALFEVAPHLPDSARQFVMDEIDANELGLALEALVDELEHQHAPLRESVVADLSALGGAMGMAIDVVGRLAPLIVEGSLWSGGVPCLGSAANSRQPPAPSAG